MTGLALKLRLPLGTRVDLTGITPDALARLSLPEIERLAVPAGGRNLPLAELFFVERGRDRVLLFEIGDARLDHLGAGMKAGEIIVDGPVGVWAGRGMTGGILRIGGDAGDFPGAELAGGRIEVAGNAGSHMGAASSGSRRGMMSGVLKVAGSVGARAAERQRGGLIVIGGDAGEGLAAEMIAGTVAVHGAIAPGMGRGMKRGSVISRAVPDLPVGFADTGTHELIALRLMAHRVPELAGVIGDAMQARRLVGDVLMGGQGEILVPAG